MTRRGWDFGLVVLTSEAGLWYRFGGWALRAFVNIAWVLGGLGLTLLGKRVTGLRRSGRAESNISLHLYKYILI